MHPIAKKFHENKTSIFVSYQWIKDGKISGIGTMTVHMARFSSREYLDIIRAHINKEGQYFGNGVAHIISIAFLPKDDEK